MSNVKPIPEGYHSLTPFLNLKGAAQAIEFYKKAFGAEERFRMPGPNGVVMHAELKIGDSILMVSEAMQEPPTTGAIHLYVNDVDKVWKQAIAAGGKEVTPLANMFWGDRFGRLTDPYGNKWALSTHVEDVPPAEMEKRMKAAANK
jgi:PhnB protein